MLPRRTIAELETRYRLEPDLEDVFVEGVFDKHVLDEVFSLKGKKDRAVYNIDTVEIPFALLKSDGLTEGNKQRVIYLARRTSSLSEKCKFRCLADKDLDGFCSDLEETNRLVWTKFASIEACFFNRKCLERILVTITNCANLDIDSFLTSSNIALKKLFAFRLAGRDMGLDCKWPCPKKNFSINSGGMLFDETGYLNRLIGQNSMNNKRVAFSRKFDERYKQISDMDVQVAVRGHDFTKLLAWKISKSSQVKTMGEDKIVERIFISMIDEADDILSGLNV